MEISMDNVRFYPSGDGAVTMEFSRVIDPKINQRILQLDRDLEDRPIPGIRETIPTYGSILVLYDNRQMDYETLCRNLELRWTEVSKGDSGRIRLWKIPCCYSRYFGPDLDWVCRSHDLTREEVIRMHSGVDYPIYMLGFLPGFVYLGGMNPELETPRLSVPRLRIPAGSVGIGGVQTGVYPLDSPGGWQLIGRTPLNLYDPNREEPVLCRAGDRIRFVPISSCDYYDIRQDMLHGRNVWESSVIETERGR